MMSGDATETHEYREAFTKAGHRSTTALELRNRLAAVVRSLETAAARHPDDEVVRGHLSSCGIRLARLDSFIDDPEGFEGTASVGTPTRNRADPSSSSASPSGKKGATPKLSMFKLQANLMEKVKRQQEEQHQNSPASKCSPFDSLRKEILAHLHSEIFKVMK